VAVRAAILALLVLGGGVALWQSRSHSEASGTVDAARSCLDGTSGFHVRENEEAKGARQLLVTTPAGRVTRDGNITMTHDSSATVIFFKSPQDAARWSDALGDISRAAPGEAAPNETVGNVIIGWSVPAPESERQAVHDCVSG
jgi:hypothetical protein